MARSRIREVVSSREMPVLDEATVALDLADRDVLFRAIREFVAGGRLVLFVSHRLDEVQRLSDRVTVLRSGRAVETLERASLTGERLPRLMIPDAPTAAHLHA